MTHQLHTNLKLLDLHNDILGHIIRNQNYFSLKFLPLVCSRLNQIFYNYVTTIEASSPHDLTSVIGIIRLVYLRSLLGNHQTPLTNIFLRSDATVTTLQPAPFIVEARELFPLLGRCTQLESFVLRQSHFEFCNYTSNHFRFLAHCTNLKSLIMNPSRVILVKDMHHTISSLNNLQFLCMNGFIGYDLIKAIKTTRLTHLHINSHIVASAFGRTLPDLMETDHRLVNVGNMPGTYLTSITFEDLIVLTKIGQNLINLTLNVCDIAFRDGAFITETAEIFSKFAIHQISKFPLKLLNIAFKNAPSEFVQTFLTISTLERLSIHSILHLDNEHLKGISALKRLVYFRLLDTPMLNEIGMQYILACQTLQNLEISNNSLFQDKYLIPLYKTPNNIKTLILKSVKTISDVGLEYISKTTIESLELFAVHLFTNNGIHKITLMPSIRKLSIKQCYGMKDIEYEVSKIPDPPIVQALVLSHVHESARPQNLRYRTCTLVTQSGQNGIVKRPNKCWIDACSYGMITRCAGCTKHVCKPKHGVKCTRCKNFHCSQCIDQRWGNSTINSRRAICKSCCVSLGLGFNKL